MIHVSLTSEFPWQRNDTHYVFYTPLYFSVPGIFRKSLELVPPFVASFMGKFEQFLWERFGDILERRVKGTQLADTHAH